MISSLSGRVAHVEDTSITLEIAGVGFRINVPRPLASEVHAGQILSLHTYLVVRETELSLYGFRTLEAREMFTLLIGVDRVGPRLALAILSHLNPAALRAAVNGGQSSVLARVPGVGSKTAQKVVLHLADKVSSHEGDEAAIAMTQVDSELVEALTGLGYSVVEAQAAVQSLPKDAPTELEERLKDALRYFSTPV